MATDKTKVAEARHEIRHALLSLIASIAVASLGDEEAIEIIGDMLEAWKGFDMHALKIEIEHLLRAHSGRSDMENITRHSHELRQKIKDFQRLGAR